MHYQYLVGLTTASKIISETCSAIWDTLCPVVLPPIIEVEEWLKIAKDFEKIWHFPLCVGAIDGKYVIFQVRDTSILFINKMNRLSQSKHNVYTLWSYG